VPTVPKLHTIRRGRMSEKLPPYWVRLYPSDEPAVTQAISNGAKFSDILTEMQRNQQPQPLN
jgi:hypothetical protein